MLENSFPCAATKIMTACKRSKQDGRLRHIVAKDADGAEHKIVLRRPDAGHFWTNGTEVGMWAEGADSGEASPELLVIILRGIS